MTSSVGNVGGQLDFVREEFAGGEAYRIRSARLRDPIIRSVYRMYGVTSASRTDFPGAQPCSVMRENLEAIGSRHYVVAEKTDGTRFLMLVTESAQPSDMVIMIDRSMSMWILPLFFQPWVHAEQCLFDGELVYNEVKREWTYQIFDLVGCGSRYRSRDTYIQRLKNARTLIRNEMIESQQPIAKVMVKRFYPTYEIDRLLPSVHMHDGCRTDGLIFTPVLHDVKPFRNRHMFKWKDGLDHTADLMLRYNSEKARHAIDERYAEEERKEKQKLEEERQNKTATKRRVEEEEEEERKKSEAEEKVAKEERCQAEVAAMVPRKKKPRRAATRSKPAASRLGSKPTDNNGRYPVRKTVRVTRENLCSLEMLSEFYLQWKASLHIKQDVTENEADEREENDGDKDDGDSSVFQPPKTCERSTEGEEKHEVKHEVKQEVKQEGRSDARNSSLSSTATIDNYESAKARDVFDILKSVRVPRKRKVGCAALSPQRIDLTAFEFWLVNRSKELNYFADVDGVLNRAFLAKNSVRVADGEQMVVECRFESGRWKILKHRGDRERPNTEFTVEKTLQNISENITLDEIAAVSRNNTPPGGIPSGDGGPRRIQGLGSQTPTAFPQRQHRRDDRGFANPFAAAVEQQRYQQTQPTNYGRGAPIPQQQQYSNSNRQYYDPNRSNPQQQRYQQQQQEPVAYGRLQQQDRQIQQKQQWKQQRQQRHSQYSEPPRSFERLPNHKSFLDNIAQPSHSVFQEDQYGSSQRLRENASGGHDSSLRLRENASGGHDSSQRLRENDFDDRGPPPAGFDFTNISTRGTYPSASRSPSPLDDRNSETIDVEEYDPCNPSMSTAATNSSVLSVPTGCDVSTLLAQLQTTLQQNPNSALSALAMQNDGAIENH